MGKDWTARIIRLSGGFFINLSAGFFAGVCGAPTPLKKLILLLHAVHVLQQLIIWGIHWML